MLRGPALTVILILLVSIPCISQQVTGNLECRITDSTGTPIVVVNVQLSGPSLQGVRGAASDAYGYVHVLAVPGGLYRIEISHVGYRRIIFENVSIRLGSTTNLGEIRLQSQTLELPEIIISEPKLLIDPASTDIGGNLSAKEFANLPIERNYRSITSLLPQANQSFLGDEVNISGATGLENKYFIDGVDVTDLLNGRTGTDLPYNFIREIQVREGGYEAEYRSALGGVLNVVTHSGGNDFHGEVFGFFTSDRFAAKPRPGLLDPALGAFTQYDVGFSLGGPIIRDELWFFGAYNPTFALKDAVVPGLGIFPDKSTTHIFAGKMSWRASSKMMLSLSLFGDPNVQDAVGPPGSSIPIALENPDPYLTERRRGGVNISLHGTYALSDEILLDATLSRITRDESFHPATERGRNEIVFINRETGVWSGGSFGRADNSRSGTTLDLNGTVIAGMHTLKAGFSSRYIGATIDEQSPHELIRYSDTRYRLFSGYGIGSVHSRIPSLFMQDSWQVSERLRTNVGLRWDGQFLVGSDGNVDQKILDQWQPRVGVVFLLVQDGSQKLSASFGRFYQDVGLAVSTLYLFSNGGYTSIAYDHDPRVNSAGGDTTVGFSASIQPEDKDMKGQHFDEFALGYEQLIGGNFKVSARGIYRTLREAIEDGYVPEKDNYFFGNPGSGVLSQFPKAKREYIAFVLTLEKSGPEAFNFLVSYVLSRNYGNYSGLFDSDYHAAAPNLGLSFDILETLQNATGLLPNDRTHVFKFFCTYRFDFGLTVGSSLQWEIGTPLSEFGGTLTVPGYHSFIGQRGTAGRTPSLWDLNMRFVYDLSVVAGTVVKPRLILDIFHVGNPRKAVDFDQTHFFNVDKNGNEIDPNPTYGLANRYQPPMAVRLGMEIYF